MSGILDEWCAAVLPFGPRGPAARRNDTCPEPQVRGTVGGARGRGTRGKAA